MRAWSEIRLCEMGFMASLMQAVTCFKDDMMRCDLYDIFNKCMAGGLLGATRIRDMDTQIQNVNKTRGDEEATRKKNVHQSRGKSSEILTDV